MAADADIRPWLDAHPRAASAYTALRIRESYDHIDRILDRFGDTRRERALDAGCGSAFDSFAIARRFEAVTAIDVSHRRIAASRLLARRAGLRRIHFERRSAEDVPATRSHDFVYCNIMSELATSRRTLAASLTGALREGGGIFYAEECEGYAPMEIERALAERDVNELFSRLHQLVNGLLGIPRFRFYFAGTAPELFRELGFSVVATDRRCWHELPYVESVWLRLDAVKAPVDGGDRDYATPNPELAALRAEVGAITGGVATARLLEAALAHAGARLSIYAPLVAAAADILGEQAGRPVPIRARLAHKLRRAAAPDWNRVEAALAEFREQVDSIAAR